MSNVDLPAGYRWAQEHEVDRKDARMVWLTFDAEGNEYTHNEADLAVPCTEHDLVTYHEGRVWGIRCTLCSFLLID